MPQEMNGGLIFDLLQELMIRRIMDLYRGKEKYIHVKPYIGIDGLIGFKGSILKKHPLDGSFKTVEMEIAVLDDLGHPLHNIEDIGGRCAARGEIVKTGYIFQCKDCNDNFCEKHIRFLDRKKEYPLCEKEGNGCFKPYKKIFERGREIERQKMFLEAEISLANTLQRYFAALKQAEQAKEEFKNSRKGFFAKLLSPNLLPPPLACPNCNFNPSYHKVTCKQCRQVFEIRANSSRICPQCGTAARQVICQQCQSIINL